MNYVYVVIAVNELNYLGLSVYRLKFGNYLSYRGNSAEIS